ncbi:MAG: rRNA maturation RNase YbeY [Bacteroidales bacterium]
MTFQVTFTDIGQIHLDKKVIGNCINSVFKDSKFTASYIQIVIGSDSYIREINKQFLQHNYFTDVITFAERKKNSISGEIFISLTRIVDNSRKFANGNFIEELYRVIIHGLLHLIGYNDKEKEEKEEMKKMEDYYLMKIDLK